MGLLILNAPNAWACNIIISACGSQNYCVTGTYFVGGVQDMNGGTPPYPQKVQAGISSYNPSPMWSTSSAWTMLDNRTYSGCNAGCFAQVGWLHWYGCQSGLSGSNGTCSDGNEHVFVEWTDNSGVAQTIFYYNVPSGSETYTVIRDQNLGTYTFHWNEGAIAGPRTVNFGPSGIQNLEEVHDQDSGCCAAGSQFGGDYANQVAFTNVTWWDGQGTAFVPQMSPLHNGSGDVGTLTPGSNFHVWDSRC